MRHSDTPRTAAPRHRLLHSGSAVAVAHTAAPRLSSRNLDLCLLAVCSCVLTVLCHQTIPISSASSASTASAMTASSTSPAQIAFTLKAGLFAASQQKDGIEIHAEQEED